MAYFAALQRSAGLWLGLWAMAWLLLLDWMVNAWPAHHLPAESADAIAIPTTRLLGLSEAVSFSWLVVITGLLAGAIPGLLHRFMVLTRLDPQGWSEHCFRWATGGVIRFGLLMSLALLMGHWMRSAPSGFVDFDFWWTSWVISSLSARRSSSGEKLSWPGTGRANGGCLSGLARGLL